MELSQLHFAYPLWLWALFVIPITAVLLSLFNKKHHSSHQLEKFIDKHLLPYLLVKNSHTKKSFWRTLFIWSIVWTCLTLALAGPRWSFREVETFSRDQSLVILLDLSESMNVSDIKPSRLVRAKQKIEDILGIAKGVKIGLVAFAADPHMITPLTEDKGTILHLLSSLETDLMYVQGSRLSSALEMASNMLEVEFGTNKALLIISDGGFEDANAFITAKKLASKGIIIHVMGVGTIEGAPLVNVDRKHHTKNTIPILSKLERERLHEISKIGNGSYLEANYSVHEVKAILNELEKRADAQVKIGKKNRLWDEHFYLLIIPILPIILFWFRRGYVFAAILILFTPSLGLDAASFQDYFKNSEELGKQAFENEDYEKACEAFQDSYRKGVAYYKAKNFAEAEKMFRQSTREEVASNAAYNLGNSLAYQQKFKEAIIAYEDVLKKWPDHTKAKENLELVKKMLEEHKKEPPPPPEKPQDPKDNEKENESENKEDSNDSNGDRSSQDDDEQKEKENQESNEEENEDLDDQKDDQKEDQKQEVEASANKAEQKVEQKMNASKSQEDQDADLWLNRIVNDPKKFLKNKFSIESKKYGTKEGIDPW